MFSNLDFDIRPGLGAGPFDIGTSLWSVLATLRTLQHMFPQVEIKYDPDTSATTPIILHVRPHVDLLFSGQHQRLNAICVRRLRDPHPPVTLRYKDTILSSPEEVLRRVGVSRAFGPTYPGDDLKYPGVWFSFEEEGMGEGIKGVVLDNDRRQEVRRVIVSQKGSNGREPDALDDVNECDIMHGDISRASVKVHDGVALYFYPKSTTPVHIRIGKTTAQDLTVDLGPPLRVHYKEDDRMNIHSTRSEDNSKPETGYFYNYFQHGIDFLLSGSTHIVKKIIVHTNIPGSPLFQLYKRCPWEIEGNPEDDEDDSPPRMQFFDRFEQISHFLNPDGPPPSMLLDRTNEEDGVMLPSPTTRLYAFDGIILEVTESSQVTSVTLV